MHASGVHYHSAAATRTLLSWHAHYWLDVVTVYVLQLHSSYVWQRLPYHVSVFLTLFILRSSGNVYFFPLSHLVSCVFSLSKYSAINFLSPPCQRWHSQVFSITFISFHSDETSNPDRQKDGLRRCSQAISMNISSGSIVQTYWSPMLSPRTWFNWDPWYLLDYVYVVTFSFLPHNKLFNKEINSKEC